MFKRTWSLLGLSCLLAAAGGWGWAFLHPDPPAAAAAPTSPAAASSSRVPTVVDAVRVERADLSVLAEATGYLEPWRKVEVKAEAAGRVLLRRAENGQRTAAGSLLVQLDDRDRRIELEEARAEWLKIQAGYAVDYVSPGGEAGAPALPFDAQTVAGELEKAERQRREGLISQSRFDELRRRFEAARVLSGSARAEVRAATSGLTQAEQRVERSRLALERTRILAPFGGRVADLAVEVGQQVAPGETLLTLLEDDRVKVEVDVLEADMVHLRVGAPARVRIPALGGVGLAGRIVTINPRVRPETGTGRVAVEIPNPQGLLLAGLYATVELETESLRGRLVVPAGALLVRQGRDLAFRIEGGRALWTYVKVGVRSGGLAEITDGLAAGDVVATQGHFALAHEAAVEVRLQPEPRGGARRAAAPDAGR